MIKSIVAVAQLVIALALIVLVLLQERSSGLSGVFGGSEGGFYATRRGLEKILFYTTIACVALFVVLSLTNLVI